MIREKFLPAHPDILVKTASTVPIIIGINNMEGLLAFGGNLYFECSIFYVKIEKS